MLHAHTPRACCSPSLLPSQPTGLLIPCTSVFPVHLTFADARMVGAEDVRLPTLNAVVTEFVQEHLDPQHPVEGMLGMVGVPRLLPGRPKTHLHQPHVSSRLCQPEQRCTGGFAVVLIRSLCPATNLPGCASSSPCLPHTGAAGEL
jgi:hypothetical protein